MRYLLDTHTFLWAVSAVDRLSNTVRDLLRDPNHDVFFSAVSAWEIAIKARLDRTDVFAFDGDPALLVPERIAASGFLVLPIAVYHALRVYSLPPVHGDPFDRLLVAQAQIEGLPILTTDPVIGRYDVTVI